MEEVKWGLIMPLIILQALLAIIGLISLTKADNVRTKMDVDYYHYLRKYIR